MTLFVFSGRSPLFAIICKRKCYVSFSNVLSSPVPALPVKSVASRRNRKKPLISSAVFIFWLTSTSAKKKQVQDYADLLFRSPKTLSNLFASCGVPSPLRIIHERIESEAKRLLLYTPKSAKEISELLGFEDLSTFSRFFKKMTGESVSNFRKLNTTGNIAN